jgi:FtsP/CotA-like multicopper oxidase with cupredoxin domain
MNSSSCRQRRQSQLWLCTLLTLHLLGYPIRPGLAAELTFNASELPEDGCTRPASGAQLSASAELRGVNGELHADLTFTSTRDVQGHQRYCYIDAVGHQAPTLRVRPGDTVYLKLHNGIPKATVTDHPSLHRDPCASAGMSAADTNLHFHGLLLPPLCHQDETLRTLVRPGDPPFEYRLHIAPDQPPGLYWYHPHVHGFSEEHLLGGAAGAIVVEGIERLVPEVAHLPERVLIVRDEWMPVGPPEELGSPPRPSKQLSVNYVAVPYPAYRPGRIEMRRAAREFWRVLNASADTYLNLYVEFAGKRQLLGLVARDGVPLVMGNTPQAKRIRETTTIFMPPGARAEFIVTAPDASTTGRLVTGYVNRGADDDGPASRPGAPATQLPDSDPTRPLVAIIVSAAARPAVPQPAATSAIQAPRPAPFASLPVDRSRTLYFSEAPARNGGTDFFVTENGHVPQVFDPSRERADITVRQGDVEEWTIENRSREVHTFHVHQLHFLVVARSQQRLTEPDLLDTVDVAAWRGFGPYPSITLRMDFRNPNIVGMFPFHCHIAQHLDGGMMGTVRVMPIAHAQGSQTKKTST